METITTSGITLIWDNSLDETAQAVFAINRNGHPDWQSVRNYIVTHAGREITQPTFVGTGGWYVTAMPYSYDPPGTMHCLVTVMGYSVNRYLKDHEEAQRV